MHKNASLLAVGLLLGFGVIFSSDRTQAQSGEEREPSTCLAIAQAPDFAPTAPQPNIQAVSLDWPATPVASSAYSVEIAFVGHSTYLLTSPEGVSVATDFAGFAGPGVMPNVVTMNRAHSSHYTNFIDPEIQYALRGWHSEEGEPADHHLTVGDWLIRNVTTDIRSRYDGALIPNDNSIFIFEAAGLCIGHLGHLHHKLTDAHYAAIGRLDIIMVPVDGSYTLNQKNMAEIVERFRASLILPMHYFSSYTLRSFLTELDGFADIQISGEPSLHVSLNDLPSEPTVVVLRHSMPMRD